MMQFHNTPEPAPSQAELVVAQERFRAVLFEKAQLTVPAWVSQETVRLWFLSREVNDVERLYMNRGAQAILKKYRSDREISGDGQSPDLGDEVLLVERRGPGTPISNGKVTLTPKSALFEVPESLETFVSRTLTEAGLMRFIARDEDPVRKVDLRDADLLGFRLAIEDPGVALEGKRVSPQLEIITGFNHSDGEFASYLTVHANGIAVASIHSPEFLEVGYEGHAEMDVKLSTVQLKAISTLLEKIAQPKLMTMPPEYVAIWDGSKETEE